MNLRGRRALRVYILASVVALGIALVVGAAQVQVPAGHAAHVDIEALRSGEAGAYGLFDDAGSLVGALRFQLAPQSNDGLSDRPAAPLVVSYSVEKGDASLNVTEAIDRATGKVTTRSFGSTTEGFSEAMTWFHAGSPALPGLELTGSRIREGQAEAPHPQAGSPASMAFWMLDAAGPRSLQVGPAASGCGNVITRSGQRGELDGDAVTEVSAAVTCGPTTYRRALWYEAGSSLPTFAEYRVSEDGRSSVTLSLALFEHKAGRGSPIEWTTGGGAQVPPMDYSTTGRPPLSTGAGNEFGYPLEEAIADIQGNFTLLDYQLWRQQHRQAVLVSAHLLRGEHGWRDRDSDSWRLVYAEPSGAAFEVVAEKFLASGSKWADARGPLSVAPFSPADAPTRMVTLSSAAAQWRDAASPSYTNARLNYAQWGIVVPMSWAQDCDFTPASTGRVPLEVGFGRLVVGHSSYGSCTDGKFVRQESYLVQDARTGERELLVEHEIVLAEFTDGDVPRHAPTSVSTDIQGLQWKIPDLTLAAATISLLALLWTAYFLPSLKALAAKGFGLGYTRVQPHAVLENDVRQAIVDACAQDPGITASELVERLHLGWGSLSHHVRILEKAGLLSSTFVGRRRHYYGVDEPSAAAKHSAALLRTGNTKRVLEAIQGSPGLSLQELASRLAFTPAGALWHVRLLEEAGLIERRRDGKRLRCFAKPAGTLVAA